MPRNSSGLKLDFAENMMALRSAAEITTRIASLQPDNKRTVPVSDIGEIVSAMVASMQGELELAALKIGSELKELIDFIHAAKSEIASIRPNALSKRDIPSAADELDAIVQHTETAAGQIMDCADEVSAIASTVEGELGEKLGDIAVKIFEASSFQDITGQRVTKVVKVLKHIEEKLANLAQAVGDQHIGPDKEIVRDASGEIVNHRDLLNGPALTGDGNDQSDIDALLASFD